MPRALALLVALATLLLALPAAAVLPRPIHERRLANGLRVIISPDPAAADVSLLVRYDVGSRDEPRGLEGIAHLVEHVMFMGSKHVPSGDHARLLEQAGATQMNGQTSFDSTIYYETLPPERLALGLWLESDRMGYFIDRLDAAALERARAEVINEHRGRVLGAVLGALPFMQHAELFPAWHPYHHMPIGEHWSIASIRFADVIAWIGTWYGPDNATVVIAGKVDPPAATALVDKYFGSLPSRPPPVRPKLPPITRRTSTHMHVVADVKAAEVSVAWLTPPFGDAAGRGARRRTLSRRECAACRGRRRRQRGKRPEDTWARPGGAGERVGRGCALSMVVPSSGRRAGARGAGGGDSRPPSNAAVRVSPCRYRTPDVAHAPGSRSRRPEARSANPALAWRAARSR